MKLTYTVHLKVSLLSLGYVMSLKYMYILSHKILHMMCEFLVYAEFWKVNVDVYLCSMIILLMDVLFISVWTIVFIYHISNHYFFGVLERLSIYVSVSCVAACDGQVTVTCSYQGKNAIIYCCSKWNQKLFCCLLFCISWKRRSSWIDYPESECEIFCSQWLMFNL
jgi:hypothetical protein